MWTSPHDSSACGDPIGKGTSPYRRVGDNAMCPSKHVFQVHGVDATGRVGVSAEAAAQSAGCVLRQSSVLPDRSGSVWWRALLGRLVGRLLR